jgi:dCMP deaminase
MTRQTWDETWYKVAETVSGRSLCSRSQVGAVIIDRRNRVAATGYNGPPPGFGHNEQPCDTWCERAANWCKATARTARYGSMCPSLHAEANALMYVDRDRVEGGSLYTTVPPCWDCAKLIVASGICRVITDVVMERDEHRDPFKVLHYLERFEIETCRNMKAGDSDERNRNA